MRAGTASTLAELSEELLDELRLVMVDMIEKVGRPAAFHVSSPHLTAPLSPFPQASGQTAGKRFRGAHHVNRRIGKFPSAPPPSPALAIWRLPT